jgi:uncharacterized protein (TIGR02246 family)
MNMLREKSVMRKLFVFAFIFTIGGVCAGLAKDPPRSVRAAAQVKPQIVPANVTDDSQGEIVRARAESTTSSTDAASRQIAEALVTAYKKGDAKAFAALFTADGEYIDDKGAVFHGRKAIEDEFAAFFKRTPGTIVDMDLKATRSIAKGVIASDGETRFKPSATAAAIPGTCHLVFVQDGSSWLVASLHEDDAAAKAPSHHEQVSKLEWMVGDWVGEGPRSHIHFSCKWDETGNYLIRDFSVQIGNEKAVSGTQRIGFDPSASQLKTWVFDSVGGFSDGYFNQDGASWISKTSGVTREGKHASMTVSITPVDKNRMTVETIDRVVGGVRVPDVEKLTIVRKPPESIDRSTQVERPKN